MSSLDPTVKKETIYIALWTLILSVLMQAVFLVIGKWDVTVLTGNLLGGAAAVLNFLSMGITVQNAVTKEEKEARELVRTSQTLRMFGLVIVTVIGALVPVFHLWSVVLPLLFPRVAMMFRPLFRHS